MRSCYLKKSDKKNWYYNENRCLFKKLQSWKTKPRKTRLIVCLTSAHVKTQLRCILTSFGAFSFIRVFSKCGNSSKIWTANSDFSCQVGYLIHVMKKKLKLVNKKMYSLVYLFSLNICWAKKWLVKIRFIKSNCFESGINSKSNFWVKILRNFEFFSSMDRTVCKLKTVIKYSFIIKQQFDLTSLCSCMETFWPFSAMFSDASLAVLCRSINPRIILRGPFSVIPISCKSLSSKSHRDKLSIRLAAT